MRKLLLLITGFLVLGAMNASADGQLNQIHLYWQNNEVVLKIDVSQNFQFAHEIAEAKDGKPFRVVVDMFPAIHNLPAKSFTDLPRSIVSSIRSSQYTVAPTATSRIVLDLQKSVVYRIEKKNNSIYVYIPDNKGGQFAAWSSKLAPAIPAVTPAVEKPSKKVVASKPEVKKSEPKAVKKSTAKIKTEKKKDQVLASTSSKKADSQPKAKAEAKVTASKPASQPKAKPKYSYTKPESSSSMDQTVMNWKESDKKSPKPQFSYQKPESSTVMDKDKAIETPTKKTTPKSTPPAKKKDEPVKRNEPFEKKSKTSLVKADPQSEKKPAAKVAPTKTADNKDFKKVKKSEIVDKGGEKIANKETSVDTKKTKSTSRFRRQPAFPTKLKGTIVAEFPSRMVIKYKPKASRDPFETLINQEGSSSDSPLTQRIPNVETSRLVGILESADGKNQALLEDMDGIGYILKTGDKVRKGYVSKIYTDKAFFQLFEYGWSRTVALRLSDGE